MKIAIISLTRTQAPKLVKESKKLRHKAHLIHPGDIVFCSKKGKVVAYHRNHNMLTYDAFIFYGLSKKNEPISFSAEKSMLSFILSRKKKIVIEPTPDQGKIWRYNQLALAGLPIPKTIYARHNSEMLEHISSIKKPYIVKPLEGCKGRGVKKFTTLKSLKDYIRTKKEDSVLIQENIPGYDHRVIVAGNRVLGVMKKYPPKNDFRANISAGGKGEKVPTTKEFASLARKACRATQTFFGGVDIIRSGNKYTILEVNRSPQFAGPIFEDVMKVNVARELILEITNKLKV